MYPEVDAARFVHREVIGLIVLSAIVVVGFFLTRVAARGNTALRARDGAFWYDVARRERDEGHTAQALRALRRAAALDRDRRDYRLALGAAAAANGDDGAARQVLLDIRAAAPDNPDVNVQLARLEARGGHVDAALQYYGNALQGLWRGAQSETQQSIRVELIRFLLLHDLRSRALSELLVLTSNLPDDSAGLNEAGQLLLDAGDPNRALVVFRRLLQHEPENSRALEGAGVAAFEVGDYAAAQRLLRALPDPLSPRAANARIVSGFVLSRDPLRPGLRLEERRQRVIADIESVRERLAACVRRNTDAGAVPVVQRLQESTAALAATLRPDKLRRLPEALDAAYDVIYRAEQETVACGPPRPIDDALLIIGRRYESDR